MRGGFWWENLKMGDPFRRPKHSWDNNIKVRVDWINLAQEKEKWRALVNKLMNFRLP
jgi:hypothetical protein